MASNPHEGAHAKVLSALLHPRNVLYRDAEHFGEVRLRPSFRGTKFGDPSANIANDSFRASLAHALEGAHIAIVRPDDRDACR